MKIFYHLKSYFQAKNADFFSHYVTEDFQEYLNRKSFDHIHANHLEIQALSELYNRPIEVYQYSMGRLIDLVSHELYIYIVKQMILLQSYTFSCQINSKSNS